MGGPLVIERIRKSERECMNREANVIMSDWMCKCVHGEGREEPLFQLQYLGSGMTWVACNYAQCQCLSLFVFLSFIFLHWSAA